MNRRPLGLLASWTLVCLAALPWTDPVGAQLTPSPGMSASSGSNDVTTGALDRYIALGLDANLSLEQRELAAQQATERWREARRGWLPTLHFEARYSRSEGGRSFEIPTGDLMNPVYSTLNDILEAQGQPPPFPQIANQRIDFLRDREQETRLRATQVIWNSELRASVRSREHLAEAELEGLEATRRAVIRDIKTAYFRYAQAARAVAILDAAVELVAENERANTSLWRASQVTRDLVHRARAERLEVEQERARAETDRLLAASYFNILLDRETNAPIEVDLEDLTLPEFEPGGWLHRASATTARMPESVVDSLVALALGDRAELRQLDASLRAAEAGLDAVRGANRPTVSLALDGGIQGRDYRFGSEDRYGMASLVVSWNVTSGGAERSRARAARLQRDRVQAQRAETEQLIRLEVERGARNALLELTSLASAHERVREAAAAFRLVDRRLGEGLATNLEFLDARAATTRAELSLSINETEALIRLAELEFAVGAGTRPGSPLGKETDR